MLCSLKVIGSAYSSGSKETQPNYKFLTHHLIQTAIPPTLPLAPQ